MPPPLDGPLLTTESNAIDLDLVSYFSLDQRLTFTPNLRETLTFSGNVAVDFPEGITVFRNELVNGNRVIDLEVPTQAPVQFYPLQREGGFTVTPSYSVASDEAHLVFSDD